MKNSGSFDQSSSYQYNKLMWLIDSNYKHDHNDFYHQAMQLEQKDLSKDCASDLIEELLKDTTDHQFVRARILNILSKPKGGEYEQKNKESK